MSEPRFDDQADQMRRDRICDAAQKIIKIAQKADFEMDELVEACALSISTLMMSSDPTGHAGGALGTISIVGMFAETMYGMLKLAMETQGKPN